MKCSTLNWGVLIVRCCDVIDSRWASSNRRFVWNRSAIIFKFKTTSMFHLSKRRGNHSPNDTASCRRSVELPATPQRRPLPRRPHNAWQRPESAFFTQLTLNEPYNSNRTPLEAPSMERWAPLCCSPSRHACWTWRQTTDCAIRRTIAASFDTSYGKATGVGGEGGGAS